MRDEASILPFGEMKGGEEMKPRFKMVSHGKVTTVTDMATGKMREYRCVSFALRYIWSVLKGDR